MKFTFFFKCTLFIVPWIICFSTQAQVSGKVTAVSKDQAIISPFSFDRSTPAAVQLLLNSEKEFSATILKTSSRGALIRFPKSVSLKKGDQISLVKSASTTTFFSPDQVGFGGSFLIDKMAAKYTLNGNEQTSTMSGTGFGLFVFAAKNLSSNWQLKINGGLEQFNASETAATPSCDGGNSTTCKVSFLYLSTSASMNYLLVDAYTKVWTGLSAGFLFPLSKSSNVFETSKLSGNYTVGALFGIDINRGQGRVVPLFVEYSIFPNSKNVSAQFIALKVGYGWN